MGEIDRTSLFVSYAWEDAPAALWIARKLRACGYKVWMDRLKLYGGCQWSDNIDDAIKHKSFRMIHLLSRNSLDKTNPKNERQLGLLMCKEVPDYFIPLNMDGIPPMELPWQLPNIQFIDFQEWRAGFAALLKTLKECQCPQYDADVGSLNAIQSYLPENAVNNSPECLYSNVYEVVRLPKVIHRYQTSELILRDELMGYSSGEWPCYFVNPHECLSFVPPPGTVNHRCHYEPAESYQIEGVNEICGIKTHNIVKRLLSLSLGVSAVQRGFKVQDGNFVCPLVPNGKKYFSYHRCDGTVRKIAPQGFKTVRGQKIYYTLAFYPRIIEFEGKWHATLSLRIALCDSQGKPVERSLRISYRKAIVQSWWNKEWFDRQQAIVAMLSNHKETWCFAQDDIPVVEFSASPVIGNSPSSLNDDIIGEIARQRRADSNSASLGKGGEV